MFRTTTKQIGRKLYTLRESRRGPWWPEAQRFVVNGPNVAQWAQETGKSVSEESKSPCVGANVEWDGMGWNEIDYSKFMSDPAK